MNAVSTPASLRPLTVALIALLLLSGAVSPVGAVGDETDEATTDGAADVPATIDYRVQERDDSVHVTATLAVSDRGHVTFDLSEVVPAVARRVTVNDRPRRRTYDLAGGERITIEYDIAASAFSQYGVRTADADRVLLSRGDLYTRIDDRIGVGNVDMTVEGDAAGGEGIVMLAPADAVTHEIDGRTYRVFVSGPAKRNSEAYGTPSDVRPVLTTLVRSARDFSHGHAEETITVFVILPATPGRVALAHGSGRTADERDITIPETMISETGGRTIVIHEYVHHQQDFRVSDEMEWFVEGSAEYYGNRLALDRGYVPYRAFYAAVAESESEDAILADPDSWEYRRTGGRRISDVPYEKGARVAAALDARVIAATNGRRSLADVFGSMTEHEGTVTLDAFARLIANATNTEVATQRAWLRTYVETSASPTLPNDSRAFALRSGLDSDGDGLTSRYELDRGMDPYREDTDGDGLADAQEDVFATDPVAADTDGDGLKDAVEQRTEDLDPAAADTDGDGTPDGEEGLVSQSEREGGAVSTEGDADEDGLSDGAEREAGTNPTESDSDGDGIQDGPEINQLGTDPRTRDSDGDGFDDRDEYLAGTDPLAETGRIGYLLAKLTSLFS